MKTTTIPTPEELAAIYARPSTQSQEDAINSIRVQNGLPKLIRNESPAGPYWYHPDHPDCQDGKVLWEEPSDTPRTDAKAFEVVVGRYPDGSSRVEIVADLATCEQLERELSAAQSEITDLQGQITQLTAELEATQRSLANEAPVTMRVIAERDASQGREQKLGEALKEIAKQRLIREHTYEETYSADFDEGYNQCIITARQAIQAAKGGA